MDISATPCSVPKWAEIADEIGCPLCEYNLRGLIEPRCPECGYRFAWSEVLDPARRDHPFLFEHHPRIWYTSFWKTLWAGWRPRRFWTALHPAQRIYPYRLAVYQLLAILPWLVGLIAMPVLAPAWRYDEVLSLAAMLLGWQWLIFASLQVFRWSMRRARVGTGHVLRCVIYSYDLLFWVGAMVAAGFGSVLVCDVFFPGGSFFFNATLPSQVTLQTAKIVSIASVSSIVAGHLLALWRLYRAYSLYMRFDHVAAMLLCVLVISLLTLANLALLFS